MSTELWTAPSAPGAVHASVTVPGSKSQTNRALILAALAAAQGHGRSTVIGALRSRDTDLMIGALQTLGLDVDGEGADLTVGGELAPGPRARIDCGLAGTVLRFVPPMAALSTAAVEFDGDDQARARPIAPLLDALRGLGVDIEGTGLPFLVRGHGSVRGGTVYIDASASSQFVSGLLLSGASFRDGLTLVHTGTSVPSAPHIAMTVAMLREAGVEVDDAVADQWRVQPGPGRAATLARRTRPVQRGAVPGRRGRHRRGGAHHRLARRCSVQPAETILDILKLVGSTVRLTDSYLEAHGAAGGYAGFRRRPARRRRAGARRWPRWPRWPHPARCRG